MLGGPHTGLLIPASDYAGTDPSSPIAVARALLRVRGHRSPSVKLLQSCLLTGAGYGFQTQSKDGIILFVVE